MINILHISDFHYIPSKSFDFEEIAKKLVSSLEDEQIDLIVFSGDLVYEANSKQELEQAFSLLLKPILDSRGYGLDRLMLSPGNHDLKRGLEMPAIETEITKITDDKGLTAFLSNSRQTDASFDNFVSYEDFISELGLPSIKEDHFFNVQTSTIADKTIGMINLNSAWRSKKSELDRGNLLFPVDALKDALSALPECNLIFCNMHHALSDFKDFVEQELDELIYDKCDILFTGHYHKSRSSSIDSSGVGILHNRASAVYNRKDPLSRYGYCIIEYDEDTLEAKIKTYRLVDNQYGLQRQKIHHIPIDEERKQILEFRKSLRRIESQLISRADDLFVAGRRVADGKTTFQELFIDPVLRDKSFRDYLSSTRKGDLYKVEDIIKSSEDYLIFGSDKCGKTSLLWKIWIDSTHHYYELNYIPFYIDCKEFNPLAPKSLEKSLTTHLQLNKRATFQTFEKYGLLLLLDNFKIGDDNLINWLNSELQNYPNVRIIATAYEDLMSGGEVSIINNHPSPKTLYFHEITRKELHQLSQKWPNLTPIKRAEIEKRIVQIFTQMHIPFNYWTASLFMWIFEKTDEANIHNNFELVKLYIEELLNRKGILLGKELNVQYDELESYLGELAHFLLEQPSTFYTISYQGLVDFTEDYLSRKKKYTETTRNTLDFLLRTGIIYDRFQNRYTFRLKGVWEYFLAFHMKENKEFLEKVVNDLTYYLSFSNELELYAGFRKDDIEFVKKIFSQTQSILAPVCTKENFEKVDDNLVQTVANPITIADVKLIAENTELLDQDVDDDFLVVASPVEVSEVNLKRHYDDIKPNATNVQKALFILARVYRNSRVCDVAGLGDEILSFVLNGVCNLGIMIHEECKSCVTDEKVLKVIEGLNSFLPVIMQTYLYDAMCQNSLSRVFEDKLKDLLKNKEGNQFRIFLITFCLLDLDLKKHHTLLDDLEKVLEKGSLRYAAKAKASILYTKIEANNSSSLTSLKKFIGQLQLEETEDKGETQKYIDLLDKKRDQKLITMKSKS